MAALLSSLSVQQVMAWVLPGIYRGITALLSFVIGLWVSRVIARLLSRVLVKRKIDQTFIDFSVDMLKSMIVLLVIVIVLSQLGVPTASLVAIIGAMGLAVGLSLKSSLSNLASGFLLILFRPFKVGDVIDIKGSSGAVQSIQIMFTYIDTADGERWVVPNSTFMSNIVKNAGKDKKLP